MHLTRHLSTLSLAGVLACAFAGSGSAQQAAPPIGNRPIVGAIRWDAWHTPVSATEHGDSGGPVRAMERSLGPNRYHWRLPFFASVVSEDAVRIGGYTQAILDQEIAFARAGGLDYWAFLLYEEGSPMSQGLSLYLSSNRKREMPFCAIAQANTFGNAQVFPQRMERVIRLIGEPSYRKVCGDRPLLYLYGVSNTWIEAWGGPENAKRLFDDFRAAVKAAGHGDPYLVVLTYNAAHGKQMADAIGAQALSAYAKTGPMGTGTPYAELAGAARTFREQCAASGAGVVPLVMAGWDRRPRVEHPVPWEKYQQPGVGLDKYYQMPTPRELAGHIEEAMRWVDGKKEQCPAQAVLVYAWNEHDEGGWLCPTRNADGSANTERLDALAAMVREYEGRR